MLLYNVTVGIDKDVQHEWLQWVKEKHMPAVVRTGLFASSKIYRILQDEDEETISYSLQYFAKNIDDVMKYVERFAPSFIEELKINFKDKHVVFQTLLEELS